jgi:hypothetical protein
MKSVKNEFHVDLQEEFAPCRGYSTGVAVRAVTEPVEGLAEAFA